LYGEYKTFQFQYGVRGHAMPEIATQET